MKKTQTERIVEYMEEFDSITPLEAMRDLGCYRLSARIYDLKKDGADIKKEMIQVRNRFGEFTTVAQYTLM